MTSDGTLDRALLNGISRELSILRVTGASLAIESCEIANRAIGQLDLLVGMLICEYCFAQDTRKEMLRARIRAAVKVHKRLCAVLTEWDALGRKLEGYR